MPTTNESLLLALLKRLCEAHATDSMLWQEARLLVASGEPAKVYPDLVFRRCWMCKGTGIVYEEDEGRNDVCPHCDGRKGRRVFVEKVIYRET